MSSPIVPSTVDCSNDDDTECEQEKSPEQQALSRISPETGNANKNCVPFDKDQQEQDACEKPLDEAVFLRPQMVRQPSQKQKQLESKNEQHADQSSTNNSKRNEKSTKVDILLDNYVKVGESIINKTNTVQSECSTSLYRKGDSFNEIDDVDAHTAVNQLESKPVPSNRTHTTQMQASVVSGAGKSDIQTESNQSVENAQVRKTRANMRRANENVVSEKEEETLNKKKMSNTLRVNEGSVVASVSKKADKMQKEDVSKKPKTVTVDSIQVHENIEESIVAEPAETTRTLRTKMENVNYVVNVEPRKKSRPKKRRIELDTDEVKVPTKSQATAKKIRLNVEEDATNEIGEHDNEDELPIEYEVTGKNKRRNVEEEENDNDKSQINLPTKSQKKSNCKTVNVEENGNQVELSKKTQKKAKKKPVNVEEDATATNGETDDEEEMSTKSRVKPKKKPANVENDSTETADVEIDAIPAQYQTDGNANKTQPSTKPKSRQPRKRKQPAEVVDTRMSRSNASVARKHKRVSKWEAMRNIKIYDAMKPRDIAPGIRHSTRERRKPENNSPVLLTLPKTTTIVGSALQSRDSNVMPPKRRRIQSNETENVYSMLLNGTNDQEPPLITTLRGIEITQGFHKTVKNNLVIHHIPGETGPSYGYFTLQPGMTKASCRISWNLHIHVVSGPVTIISGNESTTMKTGAFASLHSGTKYSLRNNGENSALVFFSQHSSDQS